MTKPQHSSNAKRSLSVPTFVSVVSITAAITTWVVSYWASPPNAKAIEQSLSAQLSRQLNEAATQSSEDNRKLWTAIRGLSDRFEQLQGTLARAHTPQAKSENPEPQPTLSADEVREQAQQQRAERLDLMSRTQRQNP